MSGTGAVRGLPIRVAVIDDDPTIRTLLRRVLSWFKITDVIEVSDGFDAVPTIESTEPDAVILDLDLPSVSGVEVLQKLRAIPSFADLPVFVLSGVTARDQIAAVASYDIAGFLLKSMAITEYHARIGLFLDAARVRAARRGAERAR